MVDFGLCFMCDVYLAGASSVSLTSAGPCLATPLSFLDLCARRDLRVICRVESIAPTPEHIFLCKLTILAVRIPVQ